MDTFTFMNRNGDAHWSDGYLPEVSNKHPRQLTNYSLAYDAKYLEMITPYKWEHKRSPMNQSVTESEIIKRY
jgi:hypothetical protein